MLKFNMQDPVAPHMEQLHRFHDGLIVMLLSISSLTILSIIIVYLRTYMNRIATEYQKIEMLWTFAPALVLIVIGFPSLRLLYLSEEGPAKTVTLKTTGHQWYWQYDYPDIDTSDSYMVKRPYRLLDVDNRLYAPMNHSLRLLITAADVLHSWTIPRMAVKADAVPGRVNQLSLFAKRPGIYYGQCREICGRNHRFIPIAIECSIFNWYNTLKVCKNKVKMLSYVLLFQVVFVMLRVAFYTLLERKVLGYIQIRKGPNKPGSVGLFIPFGDAIKLFRKEIRYPIVRNKGLFIVVPCFTLFLPLLLWSVYPTTFTTLSFKFSLLLFFCLTAVGVYAILGAGWSRNRKYSILGAVRAVAQSISYEAVLSLIVIHYILFHYYVVYDVKLSLVTLFLYPLMLFFVLTALAETNRSPFDFSEGESELVRGFNTEFRAIPFVIIFLAEYISILFMRMIVRALWFTTRAYDLWVFIPLCAIVFLWCRGTMPRYRYDQLINVAWKCLLPCVLCAACLVCNF